MNKSNDKIHIGIIGFGNMGTNHFNNIMKGKCPEVEVSAIADINPERLDAAKKAFEEYSANDSSLNEPVYFDNADDMMDPGLIDSVLIAIPHYDHPTYAIKAFRKGLHVMCEKPAGVYTLQVREMMAEADKHSELVFGMMFNQRTNCVFRKMREIVKSGELGEIRRTNWIITNWYRPQAYYDSGAWRATWSGEGGGVLLNQCPHNLDLWQWICGLPVMIDAKLHYGKWHDIEVEDDVTAYAEYENGATGVFITSTGDTPGTNRFEITLDGGKLVCEDTKKLTLYRLATSEPEFSRTNKKPFGKPECEIINVETDGENPQHSGVLNAFAGAVLRGEKLVADGREGINGLMISNAMHLSSWTGKPVSLPFDEELFRKELFERVKNSRRKDTISSVVADTEGTY